MDCIERLGQLVREMTEVGEFKRVGELMLLYLNRNLYSSFIYCSYFRKGIDSHYEEN